MSDDTYLIRADEIASMEGLHKVHFIDPGAVRTNKSLGDRTGLTGLGIHVIEVAPGQASTALHMHHDEDEGVFILDGTATAVIGEEEHSVGPGDFIGYRKGGLPHRLINSGDEVLRVLVMGQRLAADVCDYPEAGKRMFRSAGLPANVVPLEAVETPSVGRKS